MAGVLPPVADRSAAVEIGVARRDVTPPVGIYARCWGAARHDVAAGIHRPLTATAMVIRPRAEAAPLVLVALDATWWQRNDDEWRLRGSLIERYKLDPARVMIAAAHTHAGPSICPADVDKPGGQLIEAYLDNLRDRIVDAVDEAMHSAAPAVLTWATGRCHMATNRDLPDPQRTRIVCGHNPANVADDTLLVGRVTDAAGHVRATIVNYACHPTTLAWENAMISPDFVGAMREVVEHRTQDAPCLFLQGASGELAPREQYVGDVTIADRNGRWLGYAVLSTLESMLPPATRLAYTGVVESGAPLATWARETYEPSDVVAAAMIDVPLPLKPMPSDAQIEREIAACSDRVMAERLRRKLRVRQSVGSGNIYSMPAWIWRVGDSVFVGQANETYSAFQTALRKRFADQAVVVMNLVNGCVGYLAPAELHDLDIYQVWQSPFDRRALATLIDACERQIKQLLASPHH